MFENIFKNKTVLVTGHTGFKGSWLCIWLKELGANVVGYALEPYTKRDNFTVSKVRDKIVHNTGDIRDFLKLGQVFEKYKPDFVFHLAAQPIVRESFKSPKETYEVNIGGTVNLLECCRLSESVRVVINVTSDKCYENKENGRIYAENDAIGGDDPYSSSKGCSELITTAYRNSFFDPVYFEIHNKTISSVRSGNVIGGGDWREHRIVPDCIRAFESSGLIKVRNPGATRPWQHVLEPLSGYLLLASKMYKEPKKYCGAWNFGPDPKYIKTVSEVVDMVIKRWGSGAWAEYSGKDRMREVKLLNLDISKARSCLNWDPAWKVDAAIDKAVEWYKEYKDRDPFEICVKQIREHVKLSQDLNI